MSEVQQIPFLGMQGNDLSDSYQDGACHRIVNMRNRTGNSIEPIGLKQLYRTILGDEQEWPYIKKVMYMPYVYHHETYIVYVQSDEYTSHQVFSVMMTNNTILSKVVIYDSRQFSNNVKEVSVFGQYVVVSTVKGLYVYKNNSELSPNNWDEMAPLIPSQCFVRLYQESVSTPPASQSNWTTIASYYAEAKASNLKNGRIRGHVNFRIAFRLYDGTIGLFSMPVYAYLGSQKKSDGNVDFHDVYVSNAGSEFNPSFTGSNVTFNGIKVQWKHSDNDIVNAYVSAKIIRSIVVLGTRLIEPSDWTNQSIGNWTWQAGSINGVDYNVEVPPKIDEKVISQLGAWYVVKEVDIDFKEGSMQEVAVDMKYYNDIATFEQAVISQTDELVCPAKMKDISRSLHMWDIKKIPIISRPLLLEYFDDYPFSFDEDLDATYRLAKGYISKVTGLSYNTLTLDKNWHNDSPWTVQVFAKFRSLSEFSRVQSQGQWAVFSTYMILNNWSGALSDIEEIQIFLVSKTTNTRYKWKAKIPLYSVAGTPDTVLYLYQNTDSTNLPPQANYIKPYLIRIPTGTFVPDTAYWELTTEVITNIDKKFVDKNRLQVSLEENPFILQAVRSYRVGVASNNIIGIGTVAEELSDGRFGDFPLMVFTTAGVHALTTGQDGVLYSTVVSVNDEVAISDEAIITVKGTIVFMTKRGLLLLEGRTVSNLTEQLALHSYLDNSNVTNEDLFLSQVNDTRIVNNQDGITKALGLYSIDSLANNECMLAYDAIEGEILLNSVYRYQDGTFESRLMAFTLATKTWHIRTERFNHITFAHPGYFLINAYRGNISIFKASQEDNESYIDCMIVTQPISLEYFEAKSLMRMSLKCFIETTTTQDKKFVGSMLLYARNNKYRPVKAIQFESHEPVTPIKNLSFSNPHVIADRYIIVFMALLSRAKSQLHGFIVEYQKRMNSKIR